MIGVVIVCHCSLAREFLNTLELIVGPVEGFQAVPIEPQQDVEKIRSEIAGALRKVDTGEGALILTDMFGGTPSNLALTFLDAGIEVVTGVNLPMLLKLSTARAGGATLGQTAEMLAAYGQKNITLASQLLRQKVEKGP